MTGIMTGKAHKFGDDINTDYIMASRHRAKSLDYKELTQFLMDDIRPGFYKNFKKGDFIVAGDNFGCGSSREYAAKILKEGGSNVIISSSFARIFYRNAINIGIIPIECNTDVIEDGDWLSINFRDSHINVIDKDKKLSIKPPPLFLQNIISAGGVINLFKGQ